MVLLHLRPTMFVLVACTQFSCAMKDNSRFASSFTSLICLFKIHLKAHAHLTLANNSISKACLHLSYYFLVQKPVSDRIIWSLPAGSPVFELLVVLWQLETQSAL